MPLKIDLTPLLKEVGSTAHAVLDEKVSYPSDGLILKAPVKIDAELLNTGETVLLRAKVKTMVEAECSRCLKKFDLPIEFEFEEEYTKDIKLRQQKKKEIELNASDFIFKMNNDNTIDLSEVVRQNILTQLPIRSLCDDCRQKD